MLTHLLNTIDAAEYLALSPKTLERFRVEGTGPPFIKVGPGPRARVRYRLADLDEWIVAQTVQSTSQVSTRRSSQRTIRTSTGRQK